MPPYFELKLEVYSYLLSDNSKESAQTKIVQSISKANKTISKSVGKIVAKALKEVNGEQDRDEVKISQLKGPKFDLLGTATLRLEDSGEFVKSHELYQVKILNI